MNLYANDIIYVCTWCWNTGCRQPIRLLCSRAESSVWQTMDRY